jgi:hypothetical protein
VADTCEHGNEPSGSIKGGEFLTIWGLLASQKDLCSMELVEFPCDTVMCLVLDHSTCQLITSGPIFYSYDDSDVFRDVGSYSCVTECCSCLWKGNARPFVCVKFFDDVSNYPLYRISLWRPCQLGSPYQYFSFVSPIINSAVNSRRSRVLQFCEKVLQQMLRIYWRCFNGALIWKLLQLGMR